MIRVSKSIKNRDGSYTVYLNRGGVGSNVITSVLPADASRSDIAIAVKTAFAATPKTDDEQRNDAIEQELNRVK